MKKTFTCSLEFILYFILSLKIIFNSYYLSNFFFKKIAQVIFAFYFLPSFKNIFHVKNITYPTFSQIFCLWWKYKVNNECTMKFEFFFSKNINRYDDLK